MSKRKKIEHTIHGSGGTRSLGRIPITYGASHVPEFTGPIKCQVGIIPPDFWESKYNSLSKQPWPKRCKPYIFVPTKKEDK